MQSVVFVQVILFRYFILHSFYKSINTDDNYLNDSDDTSADEEFQSSSLLNSTSVTSQPTDLEVINIDALPERDNIDRKFVKFMISIVFLTE